VAPTGTRVAPRPLSTASLLSDLEVILCGAQNKPGAQHFGSRLLWLPDGSLLVSIGDGGNPPLQLEGALIRRQAQNRQQCPGQAVRITRGWSPSPWQSLCTARAKRPRSGATDTAMCRVWPWTAQRAGLGERTRRPRRPMSSTWWRPARTTAGLWSPIAASIPVRRSLRLNQPPGLVDPRRVWTPRLPPPVWRSTVAIGIQAGVAICSPVGWSRRCAQDQPAGRWNGGV